MKMLYRYETHLHTREASRCGVASAAEYIGYYKALGYQGIFVTDHFFNGNCAIDGTLSWEEQVRKFCQGYRNAYAEGRKQSFDVFFGMEYNYNGDEYLIYGVDEEWLIQHQEIMSWNHRELFENIHRYGGAVVQAHPYRERDYIERISLHPYHVDGIEVFNQGNRQQEDALAYEYCKKLGLPMTSGSDIHRIPKAPITCYGVAFDKPLTSAKDYARALREGWPHEVMADEGREKLQSGHVPNLPVDRYSYENIKV